MAKTISKFLPYFAENFIQLSLSNVRMLLASRRLGSLRP